MLYIAYCTAATVVRWGSFPVGLFYFTDEKMRDLLELTDEELVQMFKKGNGYCFEEIYSRYYNKLLGYATKQMPSREDAEEVTNSTLLLAFRHLIDFREDAAFATWIFKILKNQIFSRFRLNSRQGAAVTQSMEIVNSNGDACSMEIIDWNIPEKQIILKENEEHIISAVNNLPEVMRKTANLYIFDELPPKIIAKQLNCPSGTIRSRTFRIRKHLKKFLDLSK
jgi:RNA polymerase sigma-70 factor (ECF subfamily)